jgi:hypothetical protein
LVASGRKEDIEPSDRLDPDNVTYQGRVLVSVLTLLPACIWQLKKLNIVFISDKATNALTTWFKEVIDRAGLSRGGRFIAKGDFKQKGFLGSGGIGRFRDALWAASVGRKKITRLSPETRARLAADHRQKIYADLAHP